ncbi:hypothetical protein RHGRI_002016 [Rhododendron griersonianum]|uniref:tRNA-5-taurinomethyluridine 2-sulfurtransferase n=1 Tax=Rhododendron griersonianum TaxID=479676 RepID=A0AAV6LNI6_9ERIC|nr:hypothetical protein RHGRI_002016 [Rhododendron griersonianum]
MFRTTMATLSHLSTALSLQNPNSLKLFLPLPLLPNPLRFRPSRPSNSRLFEARRLSLPPAVLDTSRTPTSNDDLDPRYLSCSMPDKQLKVAVLLSGGVDSSVALRLLRTAGHSCTAFYLKIWFQEDFENFWSECPWEEDLKYAKAVCNQVLSSFLCSMFSAVDVPLEVVHLTDEYWNNVKDVYVYHYEIKTYGSIFQVSYIVEEYRCGRTPNPDVLCNTRIKFVGSEFLLQGAMWVTRATLPVDYAGLLQGTLVKDQTYFLSHLSQSQLKRLIFPLGCIPKDEVRKLAEKLDLPNKDRKDSQGICFLGKIKFSEFVARHIGEMEGVMLEAETGDFLGKHRGFWFYTIGQRQGLRLPGGPWYVVEKDVKNNVVFVSRNYFSLDKRRRLFRVGSLKWLGDSIPIQMSQLRCKVRHGPGFYNCSLAMEFGEGRKEVAVVQISEDDQGLAAGQFAAFYEGRTCLGSGVILESWDDQGFPVCAEALEVAAMGDKSKLGKPVKIKAKQEEACGMESEQKDCVELENSRKGRIFGLQKIGMKRILGHVRSHKQTELERAKATLLLSTLPKFLPCRNKEVEEITAFIKGAICDDQCLRRCLYIHGVPGTGKTMSVLTVMKSLKSEVDAGHIKPYCFVEINGLKLASPDNIYRVIYEALSGHRVSWKKALPLLNERFSNGIKGGKEDNRPCILLIDELDLLVTRNQSVLYNILDWPTKPHSKLIVIGIANTMDLPEKLLPRISSCMGIQRLCFGPYNYQQLQEIISTRLKGIDTFEKQAIEFASRKVGLSATSSSIVDCNSLLYIC